MYKSMGEAKVLERLRDKVQLVNLIVHNERLQIVIPI